MTEITLLKSRRDYRKGDAVEVRTRRAGQNAYSWRPAKVKSLTSRGCEVIFENGSVDHAMFSDLRSTQPPLPSRSEPLSRPLITPEDVARITGKTEEQPPPVPLVLVKKPPVSLASPARDINKMTFPFDGLFERDKPPPPPPPSKLLTDIRADSLGDYLRAGRMHLGLSQMDVATKLGLKDNTLVSKFERDARKPSDPYLIVYAELGFDLDRMLALRSQPAEKQPPIQRNYPAKKPRVDADSVEAPIQPAPVVSSPPSPPAPLDAEDVFAFLRFCEKLAVLAPPPHGQLGRWQEIANQLWLFAVKQKT